MAGTSGDPSHAQEQQKQHDKADKKAQAWKAKAHTLADIIVRQDGQTKELQRQLAAVHAAQAEALAAATADGAGGGAPSAPPLGPAQLDAMRRQLAMAQAALQRQAAQLEGTKADYGMRSALLQEAAGAARREVLALQGANRELQALADRLQLQNGQLAARLREAMASGSGAVEGGAALLTSTSSSPAKRHMDPALLQAMLRRTEGELSLLQEDSASQQEELLRSLALLQAAHKREEDLRRQVCSLEGQLGITRDELAQKDTHLDLLRDRLDAQQQQIRQLGKQLAAAEQHAGDGASGGEQVTQLRQQLEAAEAEAAALHSRCRLADAEAGRLRQHLQQRDAEVAQLRLQVPEMRADVMGLQCKLAEAGAQAAEHLEQVQLAAQATHEQLELSAARQVESLNQQLAELQQQQTADALAASASAAEQRALDGLAAEELLAAMQQRHEGLQERTAALQQQLDAAAVVHSGDLLQLRRLQSEVTDAELLLAPFSHCCGVSSVSAGTPAAASSSSQLCQRIRMVLQQLHDLQQQEKLLAVDAAKGGSIVPMLTPMHSDASSAGGGLIAAVPGPSTTSAAVPATGTSQVAGEAAEEVFMIRSYPVQLTSLATPPPPTKSGFRAAEAAGGEGAAAPRRRGGRVLDAVVRTAGLVGLVGALALQVRQHGH